MKKFILFFLIIFLSSPVYALEYNMNNQTSGVLNGTKNRYNATEIFNTGTNNTYIFGNRYNGKISSIETYFDYPFEANTTYRLTYNMATEDFRNTLAAAYWWDCTFTMNATNQKVGSLSYISYKKVQFSFTPLENTSCIRVLIGSSNLSSTAITGVSNWNLSSITLYDPDYQSGSGGNQGSSPSPTSSPNSNQDIINNQNNNTQDIINNNNENTQNVIENNNENTNKIIDNQNELLGNCITNLMNSSDIISTYNLWQSGNSFQQQQADDASSLTLSLQAYNNNIYMYNVGETKTISTTGTYTIAFTKQNDYNRVMFKLNGRTRDTGLLIDVSNFETGKVYYISADFFRITQGDIRFNHLIIKDKNVSGFVAWGETFCTSKLDEANNFLTDDTDPSISDNDFMTMFNSIAVNDPLNYLLTLPVQLINKIVSLSGSCAPINLGTLYGIMLTLPCINIENILGSTVWNIIDVIFSVSLLVVILKNLYDTFSNLLTMGAEKEAKEKFSMPTPMDFLSMILGGDR